MFYLIKSTKNNLWKRNVVKPDSLFGVVCGGLSTVRAARATLY